MKQRCPNCGEWCHADIRSFKEKAGEAADRTFEKGADLGARIGGFFGKRGENLGRKIGFMSSSYKALADSLLGGLSDSDCHFTCPNCGCEWEANADEDQSEELQNETTEIIIEIASLVNAIEKEDDYSQIEELCRTLDGHDYCEACYWRAKAQNNIAHVFWDMLSSADDDDIQTVKQYREGRDKWINRSYETIQRAIQYYISDIEYYLEKDNGYAFECACNLKAWIERDLASDVDSISVARNSFIDALSTEFEDIWQDALNGYQQCTEQLLYYFNHFTTIHNEVSDCINDDDEEIRKLAKEAIADAENTKFSNLPFSKRQFLFITREGDASIAGCADSENNIKYVFTLDAIPQGISFPPSHPQQNTLYVANPAQKGMYLPYINAEEIIFHEKVNDFIRLSQCLGATEISFRSTKGKSVTQSFLATNNIEGNISVKGNNASGNYEESRKGDSSSNTSKELELTRRYDPINEPYCPDDVEWLSLDPEWQKFVKQRLEGNVLEASMRISSSESISNNTNTLRNVKAAFENMMAKVDANYDSENDNTFSSSETTEWQISVKFRSIRDFTEQCPLTSQQVSSLQLSPAERQYKEEVLFMLEDGVIGDAERRLLERKRQKLGVSEERAKLIEESCAPSLSEEETEYIEIYKDMLEDGEISERRRKMLGREAESLGISQSRAIELEAMI